MAWSCATSTRGEADVRLAAVEAVGAGELADAWFSDGWNVLPGFCTNIIFSALFLGTPVPRPGAILASPRREHFIYGKSQDRR